MNQHVFVGQLTAQALEKTSLGLHMKPLRYRIWDASSHASYLAEPTCLARIPARFEDYSIISTPRPVKGP
jgi:hypothetical protein